MEPKNLHPNFWQSQIGLVLKVLLISALISLGIKTLGPLFPLPPTSAVALGMVLSLPLAIAIALGLRR